MHYYWDKDDPILKAWVQGIGAEYLPYEEILKTYQYNNTLVGQVILGPYSPGGMILGSSQFDFRGNNFN